MTDKQEFAATLCKTPVGHTVTFPHAIAITESGTAIYEGTVQGLDVDLHLSRDLNEGVCSRSQSKDDYPNENIENVYIRLFLSLSASAFVVFQQAMNVKTILGTVRVMLRMCRARSSRWSSLLEVGDSPKRGT